MENAAGAVWDFLSDDPIADAMREIELQQYREQIGPVTSVAREEMPPIR